MQKDQSFIKELLKLCVKYKANLSTDSLEFKDGTKYAYLEVHGQWPVTTGAIHAEKIVRESVIEIIKVGSNFKGKLK